MPKVSVIMASYNHEAYVGQAVRSVLEQTCQDFEFVITDDGSTDRTAAEIAKFADSRIKFFPFPANRGQFAATNHCLRKASGEYIAVLNSDDAFVPEKLERQVEFLDDHPEVGAVFCQARIIDEQGRVLQGKAPFLFENQSRFEWLNRFFYKDNRLCHPSVLIRRQCHEVVGGYDDRYAQLADYDLWIRLCLRYEIRIMPDELVAFRWLPRNANMSARRPDSIRRRSWEHRRILDNFLSIQDRDFFVRVFPEAGKYADDAPEELLPFVLAQLALHARSRRQAHQAFAVDTIFRLLGDPKTAEALRHRFGFDYRDFIAMTGQYDIFNAFALRQVRSQQRKSLTGLWDTMRRRLGGFRSGA
jgi:glycosyltransferase involved in cell wall biosynthesis